MDDKQFETLIRRLDDREERWATDQQERDRRFISRMERSEQHFIQALAENTAEIRRLGEGHERMWASMDDMRESIRANTRAVLSVLDRMEGGAA